MGRDLREVLIDCARLYDAGEFARCVALVPEVRAGTLDECNVALLLLAAASVRCGDGQKARSIGSLLRARPNAEPIYELLDVLLGATKPEPLLALNLSAERRAKLHFYSSVAAFARRDMLAAIDHALWCNDVQVVCLESKLVLREVNRHTNEFFPDLPSVAAFGVEVPLPANGRPPYSYYHTVVFQAAEKLGALNHQRKYLEAAQHGEALLSWCRTSLRETSPLQSVIMFRLATAFDAMRRFDLAVAYASKSAAAYTQNLGASHLTAITAQLNLLQSLWRAGRKDDALAGGRSLLAVAIDALGAEHSMVRDVKKFVRVLDKEGAPVRALKNEESGDFPLLLGPLNSSTIDAGVLEALQDVDILEQQHDPRAPLARSLLDLRTSAQALLVNDVEEADIAARRAVQRLRQALAPGSPYLQRSPEELALLRNMLFKAEAHLVEITNSLSAIESPSFFQRLRQLVARGWGRT